MSRIKNRRGITLLFVTLFASVLMVIVVGLTTLVISEIRQTADIEDSVQAFYSAQSGLEYGLRYVTKGGTAISPTTCNDINNATEEFTGTVLNTTVHWFNLSGHVVHKTAADVDFMRIVVDGESRGVVRHLAIDITPECDWDPATWGDGNNEVED